MSLKLPISVLSTCQAVIFDLDGVIADTEPLKFRAYQSVFLEVYGIELPAEDVAWRGMKEQAVVNYWFDKFQLTGDIQELVLAKRAAYLSYLQRGEIVPVTGVVDFIDRLRDMDRDRGIATSSSRYEAEMVLEALGLKENFKKVVTRDDVQQMKPEPEVYLRTASALGAHPSRCVVFEDSQSGVKAAKAAGMPCVGVLTSFKSADLAHADYIINDFKDLI